MKKILFISLVIVFSTNNICMFAMDEIQIQKIIDLITSNNLKECEKHILDNVKNETKKICESIDLSSIKTGLELRKIVNEHIEKAILNHKIPHIVAAYNLKNFPIISPNNILKEIGLACREIQNSFIREKWNQLNLEPQFLLPIHLTTLQKEIEQKLQQLQDEKIMSILKNQKTIAFESIDKEMTDFIEKQVMHPSFLYSVPSYFLVESLCMLHNEDRSIKFEFNLETNVRLSPSSRYCYQKKHTLYKNFMSSFYNN